LGKNPKNVEAAASVAGYHHPSTLLSNDFTEILME
jgi:hypothetical protein